MAEIIEIFRESEKTFSGNDVWCSPIYFHRYNDIMTPPLPTHVTWLRNLAKAKSSGTSSPSLKFMCRC